MKKNLLSFILIIISFMCLSWNIVSSSPNEQNESEPYRKLEDLKKDLKEERKKLDQQRLEEIRLKEQEKKEREKEEDKKNENNNDTLPNKNLDENKKETDNIPSLIVRLRGKHSSKYLCSYSFTIKNENTESVLEANKIDNYDLLLKKPSLKVRVGEVINFEFSEKPKNIEVFIWGDEIEKINIKRGTIKVPDVDKKIVIGVEGQYKNGSVRYAVVLDVRK